MPFLEICIFIIRKRDEDLSMSSDDDEEETVKELIKSYKPGQAR